jgi:hypothetical protein
LVARATRGSKGAKSNDGGGKGCGTNAKPLIVGNNRPVFESLKSSGFMAGSCNSRAMSCTKPLESAIGVRTLSVPADGDNTSFQTWGRFVPASFRQEPFSHNFARDFCSGLVLFSLCEQ